MRRWFSFLFLNEEHLHHAVEKLTCAIGRMADALEAGNNQQAILHRLAEMEKRIMASQTELAAQLRDVLAQQKKTSTEITAVQSSVDTLNAKIVELEAVIAAGGEASQELTDAVAAVKAQAQVVDDQIPDLPPAPPTT